METSCTKRNLCEDREGGTNSWLNSILCMAVVAGRPTKAGMENALMTHASRLLDLPCRTLPSGSPARIAACHLGSRASRYRKNGGFPFVAGKGVDISRPDVRASMLERLPGESL